MIDRVFDAPQAVIIDYVSCDAAHEQITEPVIKNDFRAEHANRSS